MIKLWLLIALCIVILGLCFQLRRIRSRASVAVLVSYSLALGVSMALLIALLYGGHISDVIIFK